MSKTKPKKIRKDPNFVHLHNHTDNSMLDGMATIPRYVNRAVEMGQVALGIMDHGNICGAWEFYTECLKAGIEPIMGEEFYFVPDAERSRDDKDAERFHVGIIAKGARGFEILSELSSASHDQFYYKPVLDRNLLEGLSKKDRKSLVVLSGCAGSILSQKILADTEHGYAKMSEGDEADATDELRWWNGLFPNYFIELQHHNTEFDRMLNKRLLKLARRFDLPWVVTNDPHYVLEEEACHHDALLAVQTAAALDDEARFRFAGDGYHLKSAREMERAFRSYGSDVWRPGAAATLAIAKDCQVRIPAFDARTWHIPKFPDVDDSQRELERRAWAGLKARGLGEDKKYRKQLKHELKEFEKVGMADFLLITADAIDHARDEGIRVGPGRGSVCGTLVGWCIGIHKVDPIEYDLLFERFLNPERPKMPDVDTDFPPSGRPTMFGYTDDKYGAENVMRVGAFQRLQTKSAFKSLAMTYGVPFQQSNEFSKGIIEDEEGNAVLPDVVMKALPDLLATLMTVLGIKKGIARHPAGVIIFDPNDPVHKLVPHMWIPDDNAPPHPRNGRKGHFVAQWDLDTVSGIGLLKQDYLGLRTLDTIEECVRLVKERHGIDIDPDEWKPGREKDDKGVWKMLRQGHTVGVFQMEGGANHRGIQEIQCSGFEDIVSCTSLYRAGPMIAGAPGRFNKNRKDKKVRVAHESLKPHLERSWGELIYQEQMFSILKECAGMSWSRVDDCKTAMAKKDPKKMAELKDEAVEGFRKVSGMSESKAEEVWETIAANAAYLFNRSHAVAYSVLTYQTARLKYLYPLEYMAALLRTVDGSSKPGKEKREAYMTEALRLGFKLLPPDVNVSDAKFMPNGKDELLFGLVDIKGVGEKAVAKLVAARSELAKKRGKKMPVQFVEDLAPAINNSGVMKFLALAGAFRSIGVEPDPAQQEELLNWQFVDHVAPFRKKYAKKIINPEDARRGNVWLLGEITKAEKRKTKKGDDFMTWVIRHKPGVEFKVNLWSNAFDLFDLQKGSIVAVSGKWSSQYSNVAVNSSDNVRVFRRITKGTLKKAAKEAAA